MTTNDYGHQPGAHRAAPAGADTDEQDGGTKEKAHQAASAAKEQAAEVAGSAKDNAADLAATAKDQAQQVVDEAKQQASQLTAQVRDQANEQANAQLGRASETLRSLSGELQQMAENSEGGPATTLAQEVSTRTGDLANYLENKQLEDMLQDVRGFARRRPGTFLLGAAIAGFAVGRMVKVAGSEPAPTSTKEASPSATPSPSVSEKSLAGAGVDYEAPSVFTAQTGARPGMGT